MEGAMAASIPKEFQEEGRQLAKLLLDSLGRAVKDLASVDVTQLSSAERRRWAVQSVRMARLLATAFPQEVSEPDDEPPKPPRRKGLRRKERPHERGELRVESGEKQIRQGSLPALHSPPSTPNSVPSQSPQGANSPRDSGRCNSAPSAQKSSSAMH